MNTLIVGAGRMGTAAGYYLRSQKVDVMYADTNWQALDNATKEGYGIIPITDQTDWVKELEGVDVVLSAADYSINGELTYAAIKSKTHMCDLGGNNDVVATQLDMDKQAMDAGVTIVPDCGLAPGMAGWLAAHAVQKLDMNSGRTGLIDNVKIRVGGLPANPVPPLNYMVSWSVRGLINEYIEPSKIIKDGNEVMVESLTDIESIEFEGQPALEAFHTSGGISTLTDSLASKVRNMDYKTIRYAGHCNIMQAFKQVGLFSEESEHAIVPREFTQHMLQKNLASVQSDMVLVKVTAELGTDKIEYKLVEYADLDIGHSAMARTTAYSIGIVAHMLGEGVITKRGVVTGENAVPMKIFMERLSKAGVIIH